mgnify:CR=1 FL=1
MTNLYFFTPDNMKELQQCLSMADERTKFIAGGTDLVIKLRKSSNEHWKLIDLSGVKELNYVKEEENMVRIGACTTFAKLASHPVIKKYGRCLSLAAGEVGSVQIRNRATIAGNIANASPAADSLAPLSVLGAKALLMDSHGNKTVCEIDKLISGVGKNSLDVGQVILEVFFPANKDVVSSFVKLGSRKKVSISRLNIAIAAEYCSGDQKLKNVNAAIGAVGPVPLNAAKSASLIDGRNISKEVIESFSQSLAQEVEEAIKGRSSMPYKRKAVMGLGNDLLDDLLSYISALEREECYDR